MSDLAAKHRSIIAVSIVFALSLEAFLSGFGGGGVQIAGPASSSIPQARRFGFWMQEDNTWPSSPYGTNPTPQQFFNGYFMTPPYPAAMYWNTGMYLDGGSALAQAQWLGQVASLADQFPNIKIVIQFFIDLSNFSVISGRQYVSPGFVISRSSYQAMVMLTTLSPTKSYTLELEDYNQNNIASVTTFTTNTTGGWSGLVSIPNAPTYGYNYYNSHYFILQVVGTGLYADMFLTTDATQDFTTYMNTLAGHSSIFGAQYEPEFFGTGQYITNKFDSIVQAAGYTPVVSTTNAQFPVLYYSQYPYFNGVLSTGSSPTPNTIGNDYGETGGPDCISTPCPAWTQTILQNIVEKSTPNPMTIVNAVADTNSLIGNTNLFANPTLRGWIWNDPYYKSNYLLANGIISTTSTTSTSTTIPPGTATPNIDISFSSLAGYPYIYATNYQSGQGPIQVQVPRAIEINTVWFKLSDRAYDPYNITLNFQDSSGKALASGTLSEWGPYGYDGDFTYPVHLNNVVTLTAGTRYQMSFSQVPNNDGYGSITQDIFQIAAGPGGGYLGQSVWPIFMLGLMNLNPVSNGLANHNYGSFTDLTNSPGYGGTSEVGLRFYAAQNEQMLSFEVAAIRTDGTSNPLTFTLRSSLTNPTSGKTYPAPLSVQSALATAQVTANQVAANLTSNPGSLSGQSTFVKVYLNAPLVGGNYYWIVMTSPNADIPVTLGRLVDPYRDLVSVSSTDYAGGNWGVPQDGPSDLSFLISTTGQSDVNTVYSQQLNENTKGVAQSFVPQATTQIKGVWVTGLDTGGRNVTVSVQKDNGGPSGLILTQSAITSGGPWGNTYVALPWTTLNSGTEYWLVFSVGGCAYTLCSNPFKLPAMEYRPDYYNSKWDFQGTSSHFEYLKGGGWITDTSLGDINFQFVSPTGHEGDSLWGGGGGTTTTTLTTTSSTNSSTTDSNTSTSTTYRSTTTGLVSSTTSWTSSQTTWSTLTTASTTSISTVTYSTITSASTSCNPPACSAQSVSPDVTIDSNTADPVAIFVDGKAYQTPATFVWPLGTHHTVALASKVVDTTTEKSSFQGWAGNISSTESTQSFVVTGNMNLNLVFKNLCFVSIGFTDSEGRHISPSSVLIRTDHGTLNLTRSSLWLYAGEYQVIHYAWKGVEVASEDAPLSFSVQRPGGLYVPLPIFDEFVAVRDVYGFPIQGASVELTAGNLVEQQITNGSGIAHFPDLPPVPIHGSVRYLTFSQDFDPGSSSHLVYVTATLSYPLLITILTLAAVGFYFTVKSIRRKPESKHYLYFLS